MTGIMKFFKPTDGGGGKKTEPGAVGTTAREVFSPVGNTQGVQRAVTRQALDYDSDVEIVGDEMPTGLKRKRKDTGHTACGVRGATNCAGVSATPQAVQQASSLARNDGFIPENLCEFIAAGVEMSEPDPDVLAAGTSSPAENKAGSMQDGEAAPAAAEQMLSPDIAAHQPTAKRQRVPDAAESSFPADQAKEQQQQQQHNSDQQDIHDKHDQGSNQAAASVPPAAAAQLQPKPDSAPGAPQPEGGGARHPGLDQQQQQPHPPKGPEQTVKPQPATAAAGDDTDREVDVGAADAGPAPDVGTAAAAGGMGAKSGGAGPATLPPDMDVAATLESLRQEQSDLEAALEGEVLLPETESGLSAVAAASEGGRLASMPTPTQLCAWLEGRTSPLSTLVERLAALLPAAADPTAVRTSIVDLAQRKCYSAKDAPLDAAAASEDATPGRLWVWEVREPRKHLQGESGKDTSSRKLAEAMRKRRKELRERLVAVGTAQEALSAHQALLQPPAGGGSAAKGPTAAARRASESRTAKAWNRLGRLPDLEAVEAAYRTASEGLAVTGGATSARKRKAAQDKEREREEKAKEREEKARQKEEEARAKEAKKAQEDEAKRKAKEIVAATKAGYHSNKELQKSRNIMQSFFKRPAQAKPNASGPAGQSGEVGEGGATAVAAFCGAMSGAGAASGTASASLGPQGGGGMAMAAPSGGRGCSQPAGATPARDRPSATSMFDFSKLACRQPDKAVVEALDAAATRLPLPAGQLAEELRVNHQRWRQQRAARRRMIGVPPTWARRPNASTEIRVLAAQYYGDVAALGLAPEGLRTWRRKLLAFPRKETVRPPYYGSFSRTSSAVTGRRPFGRDSSLDYEVASDDEWEEEPEGESLSDSGDEADSQAGGGAGEGVDDEDDGFIVGDDHLSDDEGAQLSGDEEDRMQVDGAAGKAATRGGAGIATTRFMDPRLQQLESAIDRVRSNNRPILLIKPLPSAVAAAPPAPVDDAAMEVDAAAAAAAVVPAAAYCRLRAEPRPGLNTGLDPSLLGALRPVVHYRCGDAATGLPVAVLAPPQELDVYSVYAAAATGAAGAGVGYGPGGAEDGVHGSGAMLPVGGTPGGCDAAVAAAAAAAAPVGPLTGGVGPLAPGSARAPGSGARGRPPAAGLTEATLTALADFMLRAGDQKMDKIVEGFLATLQPTTKPPAKTKVRDAIKRLGVWSASSKRWHLHGGSVTAAVEHALAMAATPAVTATAAVPTPGGQMIGTPLAAAAVAGTVSAAAAAAVVGRGLVLLPGGALATPTPGPALPPGLPTPTPAPHLGPMPTPSTAPGGRPLLHAPASTPLDGGAGGLRPVGQVVMPQHLMQALAHLSDAPPAATPTPSGAPNLYGGTMTPASAAGAGANMHKAVPTPPPAPPLLQQPSSPRHHHQQEPPAQQHAGAHGGDGTEVAAAAGSGSEAMECDEPQQPLQTAAALPVGEPQLQGGDRAPDFDQSASGIEPGQAAASTAVVSGGAGGEESAGPSAGGAAAGQEALAGRRGGGGGGGDAGYAAGEVTEAVVVEADAGQPCAALPRPMPPLPPPLIELALLGPGHPFWAVLSSWVMGGGGAVGRNRRHGPSWMDVSSALAVFEAGELEPRLGAVPLDLVRVLVAVCQHRTASHLRSGAFKALGNVAAVLAAAAAAPAATPGDVAGPAAAGSGGGMSRRRRPRRHGSGGNDSEAPGHEGSPEDGAASSGLSVRPTGLRSRCGPQPVTLLTLWSLPGLLTALRQGCCDSDIDSETDKAARGAARALAALVGVGVTEPSPSATSQAQGQSRQAPEGPQQQHEAGDMMAGGGGGGGATDGSSAHAGLARPGPQPQGLLPEVAAAAAAFRLRVANDPELHSALRSATLRGPGPTASPARNIFHAHMLLALQRLLRDPVAGSALLRPKARLEREAAAVEGRAPPPPPVVPDTEAKWGSKLLQGLVAGGRDMAHAGCRKGMVRSAAALLDLPAMSGLLKGPQNEQQEAQTGGLATAAVGEKQPQPAKRLPAAGSAGNGGWSALLSGNDPRTQLPATVLTLLVSELRHVAADGAAASVGRTEERKRGGEDKAGEDGEQQRGPGRRRHARGAAAADDLDGDGGAECTPAPAPLNKCARGRITLALQLAERALRNLSRPAARLQLRQADTKAAVADVLEALQEAGEVLAATYDPQLQSLYTGVGSLAEELSS